MNVSLSSDEKEQVDGGDPIKEMYKISNKFPLVVDDGCFL